MASTVTIDLRHVARGLDVSLQQVQAVVELLDEGNTVPFITRYRKDQTGGLDEEQIREIQSRLGKMRLLAERKQTILRSIEAQGKLTEKLGKQILSATTTKRLEDLYLPFKPKKQTLATIARARGLEELAREIFEAAPECNDLDARAKDYISVERQVTSGADALLGAGHILAEQFSERADLRQRLREILQRSGRLATCQVETVVVTPEAEKSHGDVQTVEVKAAQAVKPAEVQTLLFDVTDPIAVIEEMAVVESPVVESSTSVDMNADSNGAESNRGVSEPAASHVAGLVMPSETPALQIETDGASEAPVSQEAESALTAESLPSEDASSSTEPTPAKEVPSKFPVQATVSRRSQEREKAKAAKAAKREHKKKKVEERRVKAFRDYFSYGEEIKKIPPHRILAINRAERAKILRVRIEAEVEAMHAAIDELIAPAEHPHRDYLRGCARDALARLILPALEREARRELTDWAESHAVSVFARNLRNLLLQQPIRQRRVLAVDPGFKSGCKLAALDQFGNVLGHDVIFLIGKPERKSEAKTKSLALIRKFELTVVAIGNGTACRETEEFFAELISTDLKEEKVNEESVGYVIVNEAGASVYSTSQMGREEFPQYDATLRGAISIGRRLLDPLSELVKIEPANIGVGLYQHDVKAKHLQTSLDEVVESCVNYVGVDVNTASPALLRYVSGLNQLTARRVYEHRRERGPFRNREQLREVPGFGEATFIQAAGFLKITAGDNPLDVTWIHPESYTVTTSVLERLGSTPTDLTDKERVAALADQVSKVDIAALSKDLAVGELTLRDILAQLARPGRDPREDLPSPVFKQGILKLEDLSAGMELNGTILNVVDFGCFVDIGMHDSGLVHVSRLANRFIRDPHEVVAVGDIVRVWVVEVDKERRRVSLTMVAPGSERPVRPAHGEGGERHGDGSGQAGDGSQGADQGRPRWRGGRRDQGPGGQGSQAAGATGTGPGGQAQGGQGQGSYRSQRPQRLARPAATGATQASGEAASGQPSTGQGQAHQGQGNQGHGGRTGGQQGGYGGGQGRGGQGQGGQGRGGQGGGGNRRPQTPAQPRSLEFKSREVVAKPLTEGMKKGKEPMRTFGDLRQFFEVAKGPKKEPPKATPGPDATTSENAADALPIPKAPGLRPGDNEPGKPSHAVPAHESEPVIAAADRIEPVANPDPLPLPANDPAGAKVDDGGEPSQ